MNKFYCINELKYCFVNVYDSLQQNYIAINK